MGMVDTRLPWTVIADTSYVRVLGLCIRPILSTSPISENQGKRNQAFFKKSI